MGVVSTGHICWLPPLDPRSVFAKKLEFMSIMDLEAMSLICIDPHNVAVLKRLSKSSHQSINHNPREKSCGMPKHLKLAIIDRCGHFECFKAAESHTNSVAPQIPVLKASYLCERMLCICIHL
jgi:hypothetical protein